MTKIRANTQSVDNIDTKSGMMITELSHKEKAGEYGTISGQMSRRSRRSPSPKKQKAQSTTNAQHTGMNNLMQAGQKTEKSIEIFETIGGRKEKMLEQNAQRLDELLKKSRMRRQKAPTIVKQAIDDKLYFA